ncbi:MAG: DUF1553 domain-containing protein [Chthoniobacter sp.]|uniref:DUF1553 domain-containing protein n=1 Tax=Chthoniobacter sp. TaxID=2510640 RepID=UPI0032AD30E6
MNLILRLLAPVALSASAFAAGYDDLVTKDKPIAHWNSNPEATKPLLQGGADLGDGPRPPAYPQFGESTHALALHQPGASLRLADTDQRFAFKKGESITIESWVQCDSLGHGQNSYIIGKGRTGRAGQPPHNQNWGLRLREADGSARVSFVFRDERDATKGGEEFWHRWTSTTGFLPGDGWHHVAVSYKFGEPASAKCWIDGAPVTGEWDMGGATDLGPWSDNDEVWIGTSMGGSAASSLRGRLDEIAVYRTALTDAAIKARTAGLVAKPAVVKAPVVKLNELPKGLVRVEIFEHGVSEAEVSAANWTSNDSDTSKVAAGVEASWSNVPATRTESWNEQAFALADIISKYSPRGVRRDRSIPFLVRMAGAVTFPAGENRLLVRAMRGGRLSIDGQIVATSDFYPKLAGPTRASDAEAMADQLQVQLVKEVALLQPGHSEAMATIKGDGRPHVIVFETFVGGKNLRPELGQPSLSVSSNGAPFRLLTSNDQWFDFTDDGWKHYAYEQRAHVESLAVERRANADELAYWKSRHDLARTEIAKKTPVALPAAGAANPIDAFIAAKLEASHTPPAALTDDSSFLRRVTLDTIGLLPTPEELTAFLADPSKDKRAKAIDRLLADPRWADEWIPYWQDVLAENPAILKATLNNTGPFRFFLRDALRDNWAMDRFVTALVLMEGSERGGGSAGFGVATQNDLPMANKAQIVSSAFLAMEMKCARCHDAPNHPYDQADLFAMSAMLQRAPVKVPGSSLTQGLNPNSHVVVSLKPGQMIEAHFPFASLKSDALPGVLRNTEDSREQLAATITDPRNERFPQVVANRVWKRLLGFGIVDPVDDWENARPSHKELLTWLGRELITHDYDLKHVARLILNSETYQRVVTDAGSRVAKSDERLFASPARRRLSAEQLIDSLFQIAGKEFECEELNLDLDAHRSVKDFLNLGKPQRAWEFVGLSNERDRPALAKPTAQPFMDVLLNFGWRDSRAEPKTVREEAPNVLQPASVANGLLGARITRLSDDSAFTLLALRDQPVDNLVTQLFQRVLSRSPSDKERAAFTADLTPGYADRLLAVPSGDLPKKPRVTKFPMWSNHLNPEATTVTYEIEKIVRAGDPITPRLAAPWRERMEDAVWALMLTPEFIYVP